MRSITRFGSVIGKVQFFSRCGTTAYLTFGLRDVKAVYTTSPMRSGSSPFLLSDKKYATKPFRIGAYSVSLYWDWSASCALSKIGVFTDPGPTTITSMPNNNSSLRKLSDIPSSPNFEAT